MKTMTCRQLGGSCDEQLSANSWDEMVKTMTKHVLEKHPDGEHSVNYLYLGSITVEDAGGFERHWMVTVRREPEGWRVTNYQELGG